LIARGHSEHDVLWSYSLDKLELYYTAAVENSENDKLELAMVFHQPDKYSKAIRHREMKRKAESEIIDHAPSAASIDRLKRMSRG
jgi:hypothetical protein